MIILPSTLPTTRLLAMPEHTNTAGGIFGGWIMSQMDIAGSIVAHKEANERIATVAVQSMQFYKPVYVGDVVSCYAKIEETGNTSLTISIMLYAERDHARGECVKAAESVITYVAVDDEMLPRKLN